MSLSESLNPSLLKLLIDSFSQERILGLFPNISEFIESATACPSTAKGVKCVEQTVSQTESEFNAVVLVAAVFYNICVVFFSNSSPLGC